MDTLQEFDLRCRGAAAVVERWQEDHEQVQALWQIEDVTALYLDIFAAAKKLLADHLSGNGSGDVQQYNLAMLIGPVRLLVQSARAVEPLIAKFDAQQFAVARSDAFRREFRRLVEALDEIDWPHRAALSGGALDDWEQQVGKYQRGDVVRVIVEYSEATGEKRRPGLIISDPLLNESSDYTIIPIYTRKHQRAGDFTIEEADAEFPQTGLDHTSTFRCHLLFPVDESRVVKKLGEAGPNTMQEIEYRLRTVLGL